MTTSRNAKREELISRNVAELVTLPKARKKLQRRNSWTVDEARRFLESSRRDNDPLYAPPAHPQAPTQGRRQR